MASNDAIQLLTLITNNEKAKAHHLKSMSVSGRDPKVAKAMLEAHQACQRRVALLSEVLTEVRSGV